MRPLVTLPVLFLWMAGCAHAPRSESDAIRGPGPRILTVTTEAAQVEVTHDLELKASPVVTADVRDSGREVREVSLQFLHLPLEVPMENVGGSLWRARLTRDQVDELAVSGRTITYFATVVAKDVDGAVTASRSLVELAVRAPDLTGTQVASSEKP